MKHDKTHNNEHDENDENAEMMNMIEMKNMMKKEETNKHKTMRRLMQRDCCNAANDEMMKER